VLLGRESELTEIDGLLTDASEGRGRALLILGEAGIGKTALLDAARERADALRVIEVAGIEAEADLPYSALGEITAPLLDDLPTLPTAQAEAIGAALALGASPPGPGDRFATCAAFLGLLEQASEREPVLVLVDDAQWLDAPSAECLGYAVRRLEGLSVAVLAASRPSARGPLPGWSGSGRLELAGLRADDARKLLLGSAGEAAPGAVDSLLRTAAGNPLALLELPAQLSDEQLSGSAPIEHVPVRGALLEAFEGRLGALPADSRDAVLVASASLDRGLAAVVGACADLDLSTAALERAETAGVLRLDQDRVSFSHPLVRAVAYERAAPEQRRRVHRALADHSDPDSRAWHLAAAAVGPDADVADGLEGAADRAGARGAHGAAADALQRAAQLSVEPGTRSRRVYAAAVAAARGGAYDRCLALLEPATEIEDVGVRARVRHMLALVTMTGGIRSPVENRSLLLEEAERMLTIDRAAAAEMYADAALMAGASGQINLILPAARQAADALPDGAPVRTRCQVEALIGMGLALTGQTDAARTALDAAGALLVDADELSSATQSSAFALYSRVCTGQEQKLREEIAWLRGVAQETGTLGLLPYLTTLAADAAYRLGDWEAAAAEAAKAIELAEDHGQLGILPFGLAISGRLRAARGQDRQARAELDRGLALAEPVGMGSVVVHGRAALGFLALGLGGVEEAIAELEPLAAAGRAVGAEDPTMIPWGPDLVEAYAQAGRQADAQLAARELERKAEVTGVALPMAMAARCSGLVAATDYAAHFERALELHAESAVPFERGRTLLAYGSRLHRARRRVEARDRLRDALSIFQDLEARRWAERAEVELRAAGAIKRKPVADPDELSPQEIRVAKAVADGATNREVAAQLYLSPKTIDFHLGRVYRKLGIHSRTELATLVASGRLLSRSPDSSASRPGTPR
jgi:DNA-binding NarL/FixJ family response regulator/tetratricopeptide (TPR) repeat protein